MQSINLAINRKRILGWISSCSETKYSKSGTMAGRLRDQVLTVLDNPSQEGYYISINTLVVGVAPNIHMPPSGCHHIFTGLEYSRASGQCRHFFPVVQFIGIQYSVLVLDLFHHYGHS